MKSVRNSIVVIAAIIATGLLLAQTQAASTAIDGQQVISFLNQTIDWYRHLAVEEQLSSDPTDVLFLNDDQQMANQVVRLSFDFARAEAQTLSTQTPQSQEQASQSRFQALVQAQNKADADLKQTQAEVDALRTKLPTARGKARKQIQSTLDETEAEVALAQARSDAIHNILQFVSAGAAGVSGTSLLSQVQELQRSVPEAVPSTAAAAEAQNNKSGSTTNNANAAPARHEQPSGILALTTDLFALTRKVNTIDKTIDMTDALEQTSQKLRAPLLQQMRSLIQQGDVLAKAADTSDAATLELQKKQLNALTARFKQVSAAVLPLSKQSVLFDLYKSNLQRWRGTAKTQYQVELKSLVVRLIVVAIIIIAFFSLSEIWKRATFRYVHDFRRRNQFLLLRRILLWFVIAVTIAFALATEISSLATFAGLITAGIAVALQNVILAVAGYFFLIGRYGVRVGDRVQISGVTGDVMDIGLVRIHLMELGGSGNYMQPTGRVVVFSNSIVFQPTASFYKQIPGTNFIWHQISLTLAPDSDTRLAESRLLEAVEKVYVTYKDRIELEYQHMQQSLSLRVALPKPVSRLRLTQTGLEVVIRYPVELEGAAEIDDNITREVVKALRNAPRLRLVGSGTPNIQVVPEADETPTAKELVKSS